MKSIKNIIISIIFNIKLIIEKIFLLLKNRLKYGKLCYFNKIYWINPKKLLYLSKDCNRNNYIHNYLRISDGDWDKPKILFNDASWYTLIEQKISGEKWKDTKLYRDALEFINKRTTKRRINTKEILDKSLEDYDTLYYKIKNNGYKTQKELYSIWKRLSIRKLLDEITVDIGRDGRFLINHGKHRLAIAKILNIPLVPIVILKRHKEWIELRKSFKDHPDTFIKQRNIIRLKLFIIDFSNNHRFIGKPLLIIWNIFHKFKFIIGRNTFKFKDQLKNKTILYLNPQEIHVPSKKIINNLNLSENITININKNGRIILVDDLSLLESAKKSDNKIQVIVNNRHKKWIKFKKKLNYFSRHNNFYQKLTHPDLQEFKFRYGNIRFELIKKNLSFRNGTLLDIGTNLGYFCHKMEDLGFNCCGIEKNMYYVYFLKKLKKAGNKKFEIISKSIFNYKRNKNLKFDVVLALFVFHHFLKKRNTYLNLIKLLNRLDIKEMFFGAHNPKELQNINGYINYNPEEFVKFIIKNSCLNKYELIGIIENHERHIYKLTI